MTYAAPSYDFYDDGLVHSHEWSRAVPPGGRHAEARVPAAPFRPSREKEASSSANACQ